LDIWPIQGSLTPGEVQLLELLGDRLNQAIESARLFEETQKRAGREQAVNEFVTSLSGALDLDGLLQSAVRHLGILPNVAEATIRIDPVQSLGEKQ